MWRWLTVLMMLLFAAAAPLAAQTDPIIVQRGVKADDEDKVNEEQTTGNDALPFTVAVLCTALVMIVIVMPARKP